MTSELSNFAARLRERIPNAERGTRNAECPNPATYAQRISEEQFGELAIELFETQFKHNAPYRRFCEARGVAARKVGHWREIPAIPTTAFKDLALTCLPAEQRTAVFHSSGTTEQRPSRHFHNDESLAVYAASVLPWFREHVIPESGIVNQQLTILTPPSSQAPHSSLVQMFEIIRLKVGASGSAFVGKTAGDGSWMLDFDAALLALSNDSRLPPSGRTRTPFRRGGGKTKTQD